MKLSYNCSVAARVRDNKQYIYTGDMMTVARNNINNLAGHET